MTPEERQRDDREVLDAYQESLACLEALNNRFTKIKTMLKHLGLNIDTGLHLDMATLTALEGLRALIEDYEQTHTRCEELHESLTRRNLAGALRRVPYPPYTLTR
ncbi:MAG: hypothetical protein OXG43_12140 [Chloroflexi bacterium]|nr:hypothetical protein [Chloroflexota bacterium]